MEYQVEKDRQEICKVGFLQVIARGGVYLRVRVCVRACVRECVRACVCIRWKFVLSLVCAASFNYIWDLLRSPHKRIV